MDGRIFGRIREDSGGFGRIREDSGGLVEHWTFLWI
jgi:hypothetical protein